MSMYCTVTRLRKEKGRRILEKAQEKEKERHMITTTHAQHMQGCNQVSGKFRFCLECFRKGMVSGSITCKGGCKQVMLRAKQAEKFGFSPRQMEALSAMGQNLYTQLKGENLFRVDARDTINANMAGNDNGKRMRDFMDTLGVNQ